MILQFLISKNIYKMILQVYVFKGQVSLSLTPSLSHHAESDPLIPDLLNGSRLKRCVFSLELTSSHTDRRRGGEEEQVGL